MATCSIVDGTFKIFEGYGIKIDSIQGRGCAMVEPLILLAPGLIQKELRYQIELTVLESVSSTNHYFKSLPKTQTVKCCLAEHQTQGRGRLNRSWHSPFGKNIYLSCYYPFQKDIRELSGLSLVVSLSIVAALRVLGVTETVVVKWPNDVLSNGKKIAGILLAVESEPDGGSDITIGIGLNVNMRHTDELQSNDIDQAWTSLAEECGVAFDRNHVAAVLLQCLLEYINRFLQHGFADFVDEWMAVDGLAKKTVTLKCINKKMTGNAVGINQQGHLLLELGDGSIHAFSSGDVVKTTS